MIHFKKKKNLFYIFTLSLSLISFKRSQAQEEPTTNEPSYQASIKLTQNQSTFLVLRYYEPWGDGSRLGWKIPVELPKVTYNNQQIPIALYFSADSSDYIQGQVNGGFDQHAQYYVAQMPVTNAPATIRIEGAYQMAGYYSATLYYLQPNGGWPVSKQLTLLDKAMVSTQDPNPFLEGNPSIFYYEESNSFAFLKTKKLSYQIKKFLNSPIFQNATKEESNSNGSIGLYRMDKNSSTIRVAEDIAPDGCSQAYLSTKDNSSKEVDILRVKVPKTFIKDQDNDKIFSNYETREFSVSSTIDATQTPTLDFWTISSRMLEDYKDDEGYAYVFFLPPKDVLQLTQEQQTPATQPPVLTWGHYKGYVLGTPQLNMILRYRDPDSNWQGSPVHAACYSSASTAKPVTYSELGDDLPQLYGDTKEHFIQGQIGAVSKDLPWPTTD